MNIAITLVHNKSDQENIDQINTLKALLTEVTDGPFTNPETGDSWTTIHHEITGLGTPHTVKVYQVVPYGVTPPPNRGELQSGGIVYYGAGDEDKTGNHPRFFNWGLKRGVDNGADVSLCIEDLSKLDFKKMLKKLQRVADKADPAEFEQDESGKIANLAFLKKGGLKNG